MGTFKTFFDPRYRPPTPVLVDSEVRGTTLQKLIVRSDGQRERDDKIEDDHSKNPLIVGEKTRNLLGDRRKKIE